MHRNWHNAVSIAGKQRTADLVAELALVGHLIEQEMAATEALAVVGVRINESHDA
jgi:hypothetical protein